MIREVEIIGEDDGSVAFRDLLTGECLCTGHLRVMICDDTIKEMKESKNTKIWYPVELK